MQHIAAINQEEALQIVDEVMDKEKNIGYYENYKYEITSKDYGKLIVFLDCTIQLNNLKSIIEQSIIIIFTGLVIVFIFVSILSKKALTPIIESIEKQKQFITNAGHELKTPVAVIMANADVMEMTSKENLEWIRSIKNQATRLDILIKSLLSLANIEEKGAKINYVDFSITDVVKDEIQEFKAMTQNKKIIFNSEKNIHMYADVNSIKQLVTILLDNALKYTPENGVIEIKIEKQNKSTKIQFINTCENAKSINTKKMFDRFYRGDKSRSKSKEGYGIGLSIAKSIVEAHKGKISADINKEGKICFTIII